MESMDSLLSEMLQKFPEVPRDTVIAHVKLVSPSFDKESLFYTNPYHLSEVLSRDETTVG